MSPRRVRSCGFSTLLFSTSLQGRALPETFELDFAGDVGAPQAFTLFTADPAEPPAPAAIDSYSPFA